MAEKPPTPEIQALILRSSAARVNLGDAAVALRARFNAPERLRESVRSHPTAWLAGAATTGLAASRLLFRRRPKIARVFNGRASKPRSLVFSIIRMITTAILPAGKIWLLAQIKNYITSRNSGSQPTFPH